MDSFPLQKLNPSVLQRFITLCHPGDAMELAKSCKQMNFAVKEYGNKILSRLAIHGEALPCNTSSQFEEPRSPDEYGCLRVSLQDPNTKTLLEKTVVVEKLGVINIEIGVLTELTNLGLFLKCRYIFVSESTLSRDEFNLLFREKELIEIAEFQQVSINPPIKFSDALELLKGCKHIHLQISNMIYSENPMDDLISWQRTAPLTGFTIQLPANGFSYNKLVDFFKNVSIPPYQTTFTFTFNETIIDETLSPETQNYFILHQRMPKIYRHQNSLIINI